MIRQIDMITVGDIFNDWIVIDKEIGTSQKVLARCKCGSEAQVMTSHLFSGKSTKCRRCAFGKYDLGMKFGMLTLVEFLGKQIGPWGGEAERGMWRCACDCGGERIVNSHYLRAGRRLKNPMHCGCLNAKHNNPNWNGHESLDGRYWRSTQRNALKRGIAFDITIEEAWKIYCKQNGKCALTKWDISFAGINKRESATASLDRIDSSKPYELDNVQWVHKDVNRSKSDFDQKYYLEMCRAVAAAHP